MTSLLQTSASLITKQIATEAASHGPSFGASVTLMSPDDIMAYVTKALEDIGGQLEDFRQIVQDKQAKSAALREVLGSLRSMKNEQGIGHNANVDYDQMMQKLATLAKTDPNAQKAYATLVGSCGGYKNEQFDKLIREGSEDYPRVFPMRETLV